MKRVSLACLAVLLPAAMLGLPGVALARAHAASKPRVLLVGTYKGVKGQYKTIYSAVKAAKPGDWILIGPGDYKDAGTRVPAGAMTDDRAGAQILITTNNIHIRGMNRNGVIVDGSAPGSPACSRTSGQVFGPKDSAGKPSGRNGILIYRARNVWVENLTLCNFLTGDLGGGNQIWWDGGAGTGTQTDMGTWYGDYLSATSYYYAGSGKPAGGYGIYSSNTKTGHGYFTNDYASNMDDSGYYVGACPDCNVTLNHIHAENSILGYSGTNSGGNITVENSEFDNNQDGFDTNSENNADAPSPQNGVCPDRSTNPNPPPNTQQAHTCWVVTNNYFHDNNNPNVPSAGVASNGPVGTGLSLSGGRNDIVTNNRFVNNGSWGIIVLPFPDLGPPPAIANCQGGVMNGLFGPMTCYFNAFGNEIANNTFTHNGFFGNPSNGDIGEISDAAHPGNCYHGNTDAGGTLTSDPPNIQSTHGQCGVPNSGNTVCPVAGSCSSPTISTLTAQALCNTQILYQCPATPTMNYPRLTSVPMPTIPRQATMPNPCAGVPANAWCQARPAKKPKTPVVSPKFTG
jgi:hypothetical protein